MSLEEKYNYLDVDVDLIAIYERLTRVPENERVTRTTDFDDGDQSWWYYTLKDENGVTNEQQVQSIYEKALEAMGMTKEELHEKYGRFLYDNRTDKAKNDFIAKMSENLKMNTYKATVTPYEREGSTLQALASITINDSIAISGIRMYKKDDGQFVQFPNYKDKDGNYKDIAFPVTAEDRNEIIDTIIKKFAEINEPYKENKENVKQKTTAEENKANAEKTDITVSVKIPREGNNNIKGYANVTVNNAFAINNVKIVDGKNGLFVQMPNYKKSDGSYSDIAYPVTAEMREKINSSVMAAYQKELNSVYRNVSNDELQKIRAAGIKVSARQNGDKIVAKYDKNESIKVNELLKNNSRQASPQKR